MDRKLNFTVSLTAVLVLLMSSIVSADLYWEIEQVTAGMPMQPGNKEIIKNYLSDNASRVETEDGITITDFNNSMVYTLNPESKTYTKVNMKEMASQMSSQMASQTGDPESQEMMGMMKQMMGSMKVTPTDETKEIAGYTCKKLIVSFMMMNTEYWVSKDVPGYKYYKKLGKKGAAVVAGNPMQEQMKGMMDKMDGFPVKTVTKMMGGSNTMTLQKISEKSLNKSLFEVPKGYKLSQN